jgi:hypothetical protein
LISTNIKAAAITAAAPAYIAISRIFMLSTPYLKWGHSPQAPDARTLTLGKP